LTKLFSNFIIGIKIKTNIKRFFLKDILLDDSILNQLKTVALVSELCVVIPIALFGIGLLWLMIATALRLYICHLAKHQHLINSHKLILDESCPAENEIDNKNSGIN